MVFIETSIFTRQIAELTTDGSYRELQEWLMASPDAGSLIRGGGGCRKVRWNSSLRGKRGGIRVIYYWMSREDRILMLLAYSKSRLDDLTPEQVRALGKLAKQELKEFDDG
jgi:mRNA-degrading endonuclease RelE of RelBE toxin-antitoxin system